MNIKKGDTVQLMKGKEASAVRGTNKSRPRGKVIEVLGERERVRVEGLRTVKRHLRRGKLPSVPEGGIIEKAGSIHVSNVVLVCPQCDKPTRVGHKRQPDGRNARFCKKCEATI